MDCITVHYSMIASYILFTLDLADWSQYFGSLHGEFLIEDRVLLALDYLCLLFALLLGVGKKVNLGGMGVCVGVHVCMSVHCAVYDILESLRHTLTRVSHPSSYPCA